MYVNGTPGTQDNSAPPIATAPGTDGMVAHIGFTSARIEEIRIQLLDPFDPAEIKWRVTETTKQQSTNSPGECRQLGAVADPPPPHELLYMGFGPNGEWRAGKGLAVENIRREL